MQQKQREVLILVSLVLVSFVSGLWIDSGRAQEKSNGQGVIRGIVRDQQNPLYGILVKARGEGKNYTTSVFTDDRGEYLFPPLPPGDYVVSVGTMWQEKVSLGSSAVKQDFVVELGSGFMNQIGGGSWFDSLPGTAKEKSLLSTNCSGCHGLWKLIDRPQSSPEEWTKVIHKMVSFSGPYGIKLKEDEVQVLAKYLSNVIKPEGKEAHVVKAMIRPRGEAAKAVFTEWDLPKEFGNSAGIKADSKGMVWFISGRAKIVGRLDPRTGNYETWPAPVGDTSKGDGPILHDVELDDDENVWVTGRNKIIKLDTKTFQFSSWDVPEKYGTDTHTGAFTPDGNYWVTMRDSKGWVVKLDPRTGEMTGYPLKPATLQDPRHRGTYGMVVDSKAGVWFTEIDVSKIARIDSRTGELNEYTTPLPDAGPRRIKIDSKGNLWFTESFADKIGKFDPGTMKFTDYEIGVPGGFPYFVLVDKSDQVWFNLKNNNTIGRLDPKTGRITHTLFPQPESHTADPGFDFTADPPAFVYSSQGPGIGRVYFRR